MINSERNVHMKRILIDHRATRLEGTRTLVDLLQTEGMKATTRKIVVVSQNNQRGEVMLSNGLVYGVVTENATNNQALMEILNWEIIEILVEKGPKAGLGLVQDCNPVDQLLLEIADNIPSLKELTAEETEKENHMSTMEERIQTILAKMVDRLGGLEGAMLVDNEGFIAASYGTYVNAMHDVEMIGGIATSVLSMTTKMAHELRTGTVDRIMIHGHDRHIFVSRAGNEMNLVTVAKRDASLGLIFAELNRIGDAIEDVMRSAAYGA